ncbi:glycosyltransferase family 4 protein [soil metagenome]
MLVSSSFLPGRGGIESHLADLCARLAPRLAVLAPASRDGKPIPTDLGYPVHGYHGSMLIPSRGVLHEIQAAAASHGTKRVLFGTPWPLALIGPSLGQHELDYAVVVHGAETIAPGATPVLKRRLARALAGAQLLMPVSHFTGDKIRALLRSTGHAVPPMSLLRAGVDLDRFTPEADSGTARARLGLRHEDRIVLCFGRLVRRKGVHRLIDAFPDLVRQVPHAVIVVAGTGPEEPKLRRAALRVRARVLFTGRVREADAPGIYACADIFALPVADRWMGLEAEGLGVVLLEAAASGVACVSGRSGGTPEAVRDGVTGILVDARDRSELVRAIARLLEEPTLARRMGRAGRDHVAAEFSGTPPPALLDWLRS